MAYLFKVEKQHVVPTAEVLVTEPFKTIWERDKSEDKRVAIKELSYIEFMTSELQTNPFKGYPESKKEEKIIEQVIRDDKWKPDKLVEEGMEMVYEFQKEGSQIYLYYESAVNAAEKTKTFFNTFSYKTKNTKTGAPLYKPAEITRALKDTNATLRELQQMKKKVEEELYDEVKTRADKKISIFAKPESLKNK